MPKRAPEADAVAHLPQARELFAAFAAAEADKLIETKGASSSLCALEGKLRRRDRR